MLISTVEEYNLLKSKTPYYFLCKDCGKEVSTKKKSEKKEQVSQKTFLCKSCKTKRTCLEKYGTSNVSKSEKVKAKIKSTFLEKYGVENIMDLDSFKEASSERAKKQWSSLTEEDRQGLKSRISEGLRVFNSNLTESQLKEKSERGKQNWESLTEDQKQEIKLIQSQKSKEWWGSLSLEQRQLISEKRSSFMKKTWDSLSEEERLEISQKASQKLKEYWQNLSSEEKLDFRRKSNKHNQYQSKDGEKFDSKWELAYYEYCKSQGFTIIREPVGLEYFYEGIKHTYYPDFEVEGQLIEIKGNHLKNNKGEWICPFKHKDFSQDYMNGLYEAKRQCAITNNVRILYEEDLITLRIEF